MKTKFIVTFFLAFCALGFSQKQEIKTAAKALKSGNIEEANNALKTAEGLLGAADDKMKAQFYFVKAQVLSSSIDNSSLEKIENAANAYNKVVEVEKVSKKLKYTDQANEGLQVLRQSLVEGAIKDQNAKNYKDAAKKLYLGYKVNRADTIYLYYAASNSVNDKDFDTALEYYEELKNTGFTGIKTEYIATNKTTGEVDVFDSKTVRDFSVKSGEHIKPDMRKLKSKKGEIAKNIVLIYVSQGKDDEALKALAAAKQENPNDPALMQAEADMSYKLGDFAKYKEIMEKIVANDPENPDLYFNLGVSASRLGDDKQAIEYYKQAIVLKPDYGAAQINTAALILEGEAAIVDKMNNLGTSSKDYKKYEALKKSRGDLYKSAVPYLEAALKSDPDNIEAIRTLMNIYYQLDDSKAKEMKTKLEALEGGN